MASALLTLCLVLAIVGFILWVLPNLPIDAAMLRIIRGLIIFIVVIYVILWVGQIFGLIPSFGYPHLR